MKICIVGAGAIGSLLAGSLAQVDGLHVSLVARGDALRVIRRDGLRVIRHAQNQGAKVQASEDAASLGPQDYVFIALKSQHVVGALESIQPLLGPGTVVIPQTTTMPYWYFHGLPGEHRDMQVDALDPGGQQWKAVDPKRVLGCAYRVAAELVSPGVVRQTGGYARLPIGEPDGTRSERALRLSKALGAAGFEAPVVDNIRGWIWHKMTSSLCWNPLAVLTLATWGQLVERPEVVAIARRMMNEADAVAARLGGLPPLSIEQRLALPLSAPGHKMSMLQDLERGRPLEYRAIIDSMRTMRDIVGVATPTIDEIYSLLELRDQRLPHQG